MRQWCAIFVRWPSPFQDCLLPSNQLSCNLPNRNGNSESWNGQVIIEREVEKSDSPTLTMRPSSAFAEMVKNSGINKQSIQVEAIAGSGL